MNKKETTTISMYKIRWNKVHVADAKPMNIWYIVIEWNRYKYVNDKR